MNLENYSVMKYYVNNIQFYINKMNKQLLEYDNNKWKNKVHSFIDVNNYDNQFLENKDKNNKNMYIKYLCQLILNYCINISLKYKFLSYRNISLLLNDKWFIFHLKLYDLCNSNLISNYIFIHLLC